MRILSARGITRSEDIDTYLNPSLRQLPDPAHMQDMQQAIERLSEAIDKGQAITVFGDYDVDGVCSTSILVEFLQNQGAKVDYYIPDRCKEGYGLNTEAIEEIATRSKLMITTDCGITAIDEISTAHTLGLDVIVVDHHQVPDLLPPAIACLNPHRPDCQFPFSDLCAAGVAFMLVTALRRYLRDKGRYKQRAEPDVRVLLDLVAVATVADMVPMKGLNRVLTTAGLQIIRHRPRPGLQALLTMCDIGQDDVTTQSLGFQIGPRINARGRLGHAGAGVALMLSQTTTDAQPLAYALDEANKQRRKLEQVTVDQAMEMAAANSDAHNAVIVLHHKDWHPGVLGLVASRLANRFNRATFAIGQDGKGSGRSIQGLDLHEALKACADHLIRFGGHKAAAGLTIATDSVPVFKETFEQAVRKQLGSPPYIAQVKPDIELDMSDVSLKMVDQLATIGPFGQGNPEPLFVSHHVPVRTRRVVGQNHLKLSLGHNRFDAIGFRLAEHIEALPDHIDLIYRLERNRFRGRENLQLRIEDFRPSVPSQHD